MGLRPVRKQAADRGVSVRDYLSRSTDPVLVINGIAGPHQACPIRGSRAADMSRPRRTTLNQVTLPEDLVVAMAQDRQWVVDTLRRLGYTQEAEEAARVLPDPVDVEQLREFGDRYGISMAELTSRMGGSP